MTSSISITLRVGAHKATINFDCEETNEFRIKLDPDEMGGTDFHLPGLVNPKFVAVLVEGYQRTALPVEVMLNGSNGAPIACTPVALFTADTITGNEEVGGMQESNFGGAPVLHFINGTGAEVKVLIIAGE